MMNNKTISAVGQLPVKLSAVFCNGRIACLSLFFFLFLFSFLSGVAAPAGVNRTSPAAADITIRGTVLSSEDNAPLSGVSVTVKGSSTATTTDEKGNFSLDIEKREGILQFSYVGRKTLEVPITGSTHYNIILEQAKGSLNEVVVTALGITREKKAIGYSVQELKGAELTRAKDPNILNSLSGKVAGLQITSGGSTVGSSSRITIRGNSSFVNNTPLFVVDGIPINNSVSNLDGGGGVDYGNVTSDLDPNNIETLTVLKGATASALYGSRATNGVILITTKKGSKESRKLGVDVSTAVTLNKPTIFPNFQNEYGGGWNGEEFIWKRDYPSMSYQDYAKQYAYNYVDGNGAGVNDNVPINWGPRLDAGLLLDQWSTGKNSPWISRPNNIRDFFQTGTDFEQNVAVSSHGKNASGRVAYTNSNINGILDNTDQSQNTLTASLTLTPTDRLTVNTNFTYLSKKSNNIPQNGYSGAIVDFAWLQRDFDMKYAQQQFEKSGNKGFMFPASLDNPYYKLRNTNSLLRDRIYGNVDFTYKITDWMSAMARVGTDFYNEYRKSIVQAGTESNVNNNRGGQFNQTQLYNKELNADFILNFNKTIFKDFRFDGLIGANYRDVQFKSMYLSASDLTVPDLYNIGNVKGTPGFSNNDQEKQTNSVYASVNLSYKNYLFLGITGRNDWSSTLPPEAWSYFYPSVSLGFVFTDALHISSDFLSYGKIRGSWAQVGGDTDPYQLTRTYSASAFNGVSLFRPTSTLPPVGLKPQATSSYEVGTELKLLKNRVSLDVTYYDQKTVNQILPVTISRATGYRSELLNAGEIENKGVEVMLTARIIDRPQGLSWDLSVNWAKNKNMVNKLYGNLQSYQIGAGFGGTTVMAVPGKEWGLIYGLPFERKDGQIVVGSDGIPLTSNSAAALGKVNPDWIGGVQNSFGYKRFRFGFLVDVRKGSQFFSTSEWHSYATGTYVNTTKNNVRVTGIVLNAVTEDGKKNDVRVSAQDYFGGSWLWNNHEYSIMNGSFVKLREASLGYAIDVNKIKWLHSLNVSVFARNLWIIYRDAKVKELGLDPETGFGGGSQGVGMENFQIPTTRDMGIRINVGF